MIDLTKLIKKLAYNTPELIWENPNPSANFSSQTINLNLSNYDKVVIEFSADINALYINLVECAVGKNGMSSRFTSTMTVFTTRAFEVSATGVTFLNSYRREWGTTSGAAVENGNQIPLKIYGIRGGGQLNS